MTDYITPGVYVAETLTPTASITPASTTTAAFAGRTRRGPVYGITDSLVPQAITSVSDFQRIYGGFHTIGGAPNYLALAVRAYFDNGGMKLYVSRVAELPDPSTEAPESRETWVDTGSTDLNGRTGRAQSAVVIQSDDPTKRVSFAARFPGDAGNIPIVLTRVATSVSQAAIDASPAGSFLRLVHAALTPLMQSAAPATASPSVHPVSATIAKSVAPNIASGIAAHPVSASTASSAQVAHPASSVIQSPVLHAPPVAALTATSYYVKGADGWRDASGASLDTATLNSALAMANGASMLTLSVAPADPDGLAPTVFSGLGFDARHPHWLGAVLPAHPANAADVLQNVIEARIGRNVDAFALHAGLFASGDTVNITLQGGSDGPAPTVAAYQRALSAFERLRDVSTVAAPDAAANPSSIAGVNAALVAHAQRPGAFRVAVLDTVAGLSPADAVAAKAGIDSSNAAMYYPWVVVSNPLASTANASIPATVAIPPSGFVAGVFARSDQSRGIAKAPANQAIQGALSLERNVTDADQDVLNPAGVNALRSFVGRGLLLFGARTTSTDPEWKYVNLRRYFTYLEQSIDQGTQWTVFEPNTQATWSKVNQAISNFLMNEWHSGALMGTKPEDAYFVKVDPTTMTQNDLDNGRLVALVGVAALKPAEFVIFRIGQWTSGTTGNTSSGTQTTNNSSDGSQSSNGSGPNP